MTETVEVCAVCYKLLVRLWRACTKGDMKEIRTCMMELKNHHDASEVEVD